MTGVMLVYGITYAMEGMTSRIPTSSLHELTVATLWTVPWALLFCSGAEDIGAVTKQGWVFWAGVAMAIALLCYLEHYTTDRVLTRAAMPPLAMTVGFLPHVIRRVHFLFTVFAIAGGIAGAVVTYLLSAQFVSGSFASFANMTLGILVLVFITTSLASGILSIPLGWRAAAKRQIATGNGDPEK